MNACVFPIGRLMVISCVAWLPACGSSDGEKRDGAFHEDVGLEDTRSTLADGPLAGEDAMDVGPDGPLVAIDAPSASNDGPMVVIDAPPGSMDRDLAIDGGRTVDAYFITNPDGRLLEVVDYCLPIGPLPKEFGHYPMGCPATVDDAIADEQSPADARYPWADDPDIYRCSEGPFAYFAYNLGGIACLYSPDSRKLLSVVYYTDTLLPCDDSNTVSFSFVYGQYVECTEPTSITVVDAGAGQ